MDQMLLSKLDAMVDKLNDVAVTIARVEERMENTARKNAEFSKDLEAARVEVKELKAVVEAQQLRFESLEQASKHRDKIFGWILGVFTAILVSVSAAWIKTVAGW